MTDDSTVYDYIVIGAGSAGRVITNRLIEDSATTVFLLEAGNPDTKPEIYIPAECINLIGSEVDWGVRLPLPPTQTIAHQNGQSSEPSMESFGLALHNPNLLGL